MSAPPDLLPLRMTSTGVHVFLHVVPCAARTALCGIVDDLKAGKTLKIQVTVVPENGKANAAVIALLARHWKLPKSKLAIIAGTVSRKKTLLVKGDPETLYSLLAEKLAP